MPASFGMIVAALQAPGAASAGAADWIPPDWTVIGLVLAILGSFLLANAILFRHPKHMVRERFGHEKTHLRTIREYIFHRVQVSLGFTCLLAGFGLQLFGRYRPLPVDVEAKFPVVWVALVAVAAIALLILGWWWSLWVFRRYVRNYFRVNPPDFEADLETAREVGDLFGISSHGDDTVHSYVERLRAHVSVPRRVERVLEEPDDQDESESESEAEGRLV